MDFMNKAMTAVTDVVVGVQTATGTDDGFGFTQNADGVFVRQRVELCYTSGRSGLPRRRARRAGLCSVDVLSGSLDGL